MKKILAMLLALIMLLSLVGCSGNANTANSSTDTPNTSVAEESTSNASEETESTEATSSEETEPSEATIPEETEADDGIYTAYTYDGDPIDLFTIEEVVLMPESYSNGDICLCWKMKVRNTSGEDIPMKEASMRVWFRYLDENEDSLWDSYLTAGYSSTIKNDRAEWMEMRGIPSGWTADDMKSIEYIEIFGYTNTLHGAPDYEFTNPVLIKVSDYVDWDKVINK